MTNFNSLPPETINRILGPLDIDQDSVLQENSLECITQAGVQHEPIALSLVKDPEFRNTFLTHQDGLECLSRLASAHKSVALFILQEDSELLNAIIKGVSSLSNITAIISAHEEAFLAFFKNIALKEKFLEFMDPYLCNTQIYYIGYKLKVFDGNEEQSLLERPSEALIAHITQRLLERQALNAEHSDRSTIGFSR
jgi:hypothetical protein